MMQIKLTNGKVAFVDDKDYPTISQYKWYYHKYRDKEYAKTYINRKKVSMHRLILGLVGPEIDHRDGNGLNNQRFNLRYATKQQNAANRGPQRNNTSGFKGVTKNHNNWKAQIKYNGEKIYLGTFKTKEEAARRHDTKAKELFGDFAKTNF